MNIEGNQIADAIEPTVVEDAGQVEDVQVEAPPEPDIEAQAREGGWVPKEEWKGDKPPANGFLSAEEFVERGKTVLPIINKRLKEELDAANAKIAERDRDYAQRFSRMEKMHRETQKRQKESYETRIADIEKQMRKAVSDGEVEVYDDLKTQRDALSKQAAEPSADDETPEERSQRVQSDWVAKNDWYRTDFDMAKTAREYSLWVAGNNPEISLEDNLAETEKYIKEKYPEKFGSKPRKPAGNGHPAVDGGGDAPPAAPPKGPGAKLKAEELNQAKADVAAGLYKNVDEWAKVYFS